MSEFALPILELQRQRQLLQMEYDEERKAFNTRVDAIGMERLVARGDAWWPVRVTRSYYNSLNQLCLEVVRQTSADGDDDHNFEFGKPVRFVKGATPTPLQGKGVGTVSFVDGNRMVVSVPDGFPVTDLQNSDEPVGALLGFDETSYRMMFDALERTMRAKGRLGYLRDLFYSRQKAETLSFADMTFPYLNKTQEHAVNQVLRAKDVAIVHGPPGTGKTTTLVEAINETLHREPQVLVCAQSNMAVDWISEKLVDRGINVLRIGNPSRVDDKMLSFTYERRFEAHPDYPQLWAIRKAIRELHSQKKRSDQWHQKMDRLKSRATELEIRINAQLFGEARVIASTLVGSANRLLDGMKFGTLFIDEAAQAMEAACWIPIRRAARVVLAGDHCQLPPTVKCYEAMKGGLGRTLMERLCELKPEVVTMLRMQYRMNEDIMRFSNNWFYHGLMTAAPEVKHRSILDLDIPITWISPPLTPPQGRGLDTPAVDSALQGNQLPALGEDSALQGNQLPALSEDSALQGNQLHSLGEGSGVGFSLHNEAEARLTLLALQAYFEIIGKERIISERLNVGIISPYRAQVQLLRQMLKKNASLKPFRRMISINTVDGFQGQERDIIIISLVRSNDEGNIGFLRDLRRMNVAITRARMKLIILGDRQTLCRHPFYRKLANYIDSLRE